MVLSTGFLITSVYVDGLSASVRKKVTALHGVMLLILFVAGFGLMARGGFSFGAPWVWIKLAVWLIFGLLPLFMKRGSENIKKNLLLLYSLLLILAVYTVLFKPF
jgi:hypothetical protein